MEHVSEGPPISHVGLDFAGPLYICNIEGTESKPYICLLTCLSTRAVHLVVTCELSATHFYWILDVSVVRGVHQQLFSLTMRKPLCDKSRGGTPIYDQLQSAN